MDMRDALRDLLDDRDGVDPAQCRMAGVERQADSLARCCQEAVELVLRLDDRAEMMMIGEAAGPGRR